MRRLKWIVLAPALFALLSCSGLWIVGQYRRLEVSCGLHFLADCGRVQVSQIESAQEPGFRAWPPDMTQPLWKNELPPFLFDWSNDLNPTLTSPCPFGRWPARRSP